MSGDSHKSQPSENASDQSIQEVHATLINRQDEPKEGFSYTPLFLLGFISTLIFLCSIYVVHFRGGFDSMVYDERFDPAKAGASAAAAPLPPDVIIALGKRHYSTCVTCHQANGKGTPGTYPPLAGSEWVNGSEDRLIRILLHGLTGPIEVEGITFPGTTAMPAFGKVPGGGYNWNEDKISQVLTYIRQEWGNTGAPITKEKVAEVLAAEKARAKPWTSAELDPFK